MLRVLISTLGMLPLVSVAQNADGHFKAVEQAIEASSTDIRLPDRTPATFFARSCSECPAKSLKVSGATRFYLGREPVTQQVFNRHVQQAGPLALGIFFSAGSLEVSRLVAFGAARTQG